MIRTVTLTSHLHTKLALGLTLLFGLILRILFIWQAPFTFDEGAYLYDAKLLVAHIVPAGDALTKTPVVVFLFAVAIKLFGSGLFVGRAVSVIASLTTTFGLYVLGRRLGNRIIGITASTLWLIGAGPIVLTMYGSTHTVAVCLAVWALTFLVVAVQANANSRQALLFALVAGVSFGLAYASRKTMGAVLVPMAVCWFFYGRPMRVLIGFVSIFFLILGLWVWLVHSYYGSAGVEQVIGFGYGSIIQTYVTQPRVIMPWGGGWQKFTRVTIQLLLPLIILAGCAFSRKKMSVLLSVALLWFATTILLYSLWPALLPEYLADILPALVFLATFGAYGLIHSRGQFGLAIITLLFILNGFGVWHAYKYSWTGIYSISSLRQTAELLRQNVPLNEPVLTAAVIVPYLSGHHVYANISHPLWYRYRFISQQTKQSFLPLWKDIEADVKAGTVHWILTDHLTQYAYFSSGLPAPQKEPERWLEKGRIQNTAGVIKNDMVIFKHL